MCMMDNLLNQEYSSAHPWQQTIRVHIVKELIKKIPDQRPNTLLSSGQALDTLKK